MSWYTGEVALYKKEVGQMSAAAVLLDPSTIVDTYLGFDIVALGTSLLAIPQDWAGEILKADDLPTMRKKIWAWWHHVA